MELLSDAYLGASGHHAARHRELPVERRDGNGLGFRPVRTSIWFAALGAKSHVASAAAEEEE